MIQECLRDVRKTVEEQEREEKVMMKKKLAGDYMRKYTNVYNPTYINIVLIQIKKQTNIVVIRENLWDTMEMFVFTTTSMEISKNLWRD